MKTRFFLVATSLLIYFSCKDGNACLGTLACTEELRSITVSIADNAGNPVLLDSAYSIHVSAGPYYYNEDELGPMDPGLYTVWSDLEMDLVDKKGSEILFEGWLNDTKVISEMFIIGHDCCHIELLEGNTEIVLL